MLPAKLAAWRPTGTTQKLTGSLLAIIAVSGTLPLSGMLKPSKPSRDKGVTYDTPDNGPIHEY